MCGSRKADGVTDKNMWQPIETAPKDSTPVDIWRSEWGERAVNMRRVELAPNNVFYESIGSGPGVVRDASHWMPLPEPPTDAR